MRGRLASALLIIGLLAGSAAVAAAEGPIYVVPPGQISFTFSAHFTPKVLSKRQLTGASMRVGTKVSTEDGSQPPALRELVLELDKNLAIEAKGLPVCHLRPLEHDDTQNAEMDCKDALVGLGQAEFEIAFPEQSPLPAPSEVLAFNAGVANGKTQLLLHVYLAVPVSAAVVIPAEVHRTSKGRFRLQLIAKVPKVAGGYGSLTSFSLRLGRKFTYKSKKQSYLLAKCPDGHLQAKGVGVFNDGTRISGTAVRSCVGERSSGGANRAGRSGRWAPAGSVPRLRAGARRAAASVG